MEDVDNALKTAIENEIKSHSLYSDASKKIEEKAIKEALIFLAKQELGHIKNIKKFSSDYLKKNFSYKIPKHDRKIKSLFGKVISSKDIMLTKELERVYKLALEIEISGYDYYKKTMEETANENLKRFFKFLTEEENNHYILLEGTYKFLKEPSLFYAGDENWNFEG
jgi:rubrerythrin